MSGPEARAARQGQPAGDGRAGGSGPGRIITRAAVAGAALLVAGLAGALVWLDAHQPSAGPRVVAAVVASERQGGALLVRFEVRNDGDRSVEDVLVDVTVGSQRVEQHLAQLPLGMVRRGVAIFEPAPAGERPRARVVGYMSP